MLSYPKNRLENANAYEVVSTQRKSKSSVSCKSSVVTINNRAQWICVGGGRRGFWLIAPHPLGINW